ncbi:MAG: helix-turn-helix transcriptional regulator [Muribaculaceae bacterium]|nr:helix-turn-helix transcriptional regulator [Muribaculaceae bacterium]
MRRSERADLGALMKRPPTINARVYDHALEITRLAFSRMDQLGMSQADLAKKMGKSPARVSQIMSAQSNMTLETISELEEALDITLIRTDECPLDPRAYVGRSSTSAEARVSWTVVSGGGSHPASRYVAGAAADASSSPWHGEAKEG